MPKLTLTHTLNFSAAHYLPNYNGKCEKLHGHNYKVVVSVVGETQEDGMVIDFKKVKSIANKCAINLLDHTELNKIISNPSAENIAMWIWEQLREKLPLRKIIVCETENSCVEYDGNKKIYISLGTNLGEREKNLWQAIAMLGTKIQVNKISPIYETEPVGYKNQDDFLNMAIEAETTLRPAELLNLCQKIENQLGRKRKIKNGPRVIDLDILLYGQEVVKQKNLQIPHLRMHQRRFVLRPLSDIASDLIHPKLGKTVEVLLKGLSDKGKVVLFRS